MFCHIEQNYPRSSAEIQTVHRNGQERCFNFEHRMVAVARQAGLGISFVGFTQNGPQIGKRVSSSSLVKNGKMMLGVRGE